MSWRPVAIAFDGIPALLPDASVRWIEFDDVPLAAPYFDLDVQRLREKDPPAREAETRVDAILTAAAALPETRPAGLIFDVSRCGATLIANTFQMDERAVVLSEAQPFFSLLLPDNHRMSAWLKRRWQSQLDRLLPALLAIYAHHRGGDPAPVVLKLPSVTLLRLAAVRSRWPEVPCLVVIRDPVEVMLGAVPGGGWMDWKSYPQRMRDVFGWTDSPEALAAMTPEEFAARVLRSFFEAALSGLDDRCVVLDHENLNARSVRDAAARFGLELPADDLVHRRLQVQLRDHAGILKFQDERELKRRLAGRPIHDAAQRWAMQPYFDLRAC